MIRVANLPVMQKCVPSTGEESPQRTRAVHQCAEAHWQGLGQTGNDLLGRGVACQYPWLTYPYGVTARALFLSSDNVGSTGADFHGPRFNSDSA